MGTSKKDYNLVGVNKDHPHAYGDKYAAILHQWKFPGSSPRVWGQASIGDSYKITRRIIPTRMGTSYADMVRGIYNEDHPHAYGDKTLSNKSRKACWGSSPRVWGQDYVPTAHIQFERIIPTRMGTR